MKSLKVLKIKVLDDDLFKDDKIATANIYYDQLPSNVGEEKEYSIPLSYENKDVGILHIRVKNTPNRQSSYNNNGSNLNQSNLNNNTIVDDNAVLTKQSNVHNNNINNNLNNNINNNNPPVVVTEEYYDPSQNINTNIPLNGNNPDLIATIPAAEINTNRQTKVKKDKKRHHDPKVVLPEKHHHYNDGLTSSSSESSNEGEKLRAAEGKLGAHAYDPPIDNNEPYINNSYPVNANRNDPNPININSKVDPNNINYNNQNNLNRNNMN